MPRAAVDASSKVKPATRDLLVKAASAEFNERGFDGTDTNRIARRAGFAPQTFYRWFTDKTEIFIAVYRAWEEAMLLTSALRRNSGDVEEMVSAAIEHHKAHLVFRRSLRQLSAEDSQVRAARAESRLRQIEYIREWRGGVLPADEVAAALLQLERLADALAEGELGDMHLDEAPTRRRLAELLAWLASGARPSS